MGASMNRQRGIIATLILYGIAAAAVIGGIWYVYHHIDTHWETSAGISRGEANTQAKWDKANRDAEEQAELGRRERARLATAQSEQLDTRSPQPGDRSTAAEVGPAASQCHGAQTVELPRAASEFLLNLIGECDEVATQLTACQQIVRADRAQTP